MRHSDLKLSGCCVDRALQTMRLALKYRDGKPFGVYTRPEYFVEDIIKDLGVWFPKHWCLVGVSISLDRVPDNVVFMGTHFNVPIVDCVGIANTLVCHYVHTSDVLVASSFKSTSRIAHMVVGIPSATDLTERECCFVLMVFGKSVIPDQKPCYPVGVPDYCSHKLASVYVDGGS